MNYPLALYRAGTGPQQIDSHPGVAFDSRLVNDGAEHEAALADGWHDSPGAAHEAHLATEAKLAEAKLRTGNSDDNRPPTRVELEAKAKELGIEFKAQTSNKKLAADIEAKLAEANQ